MKRNIKNNFLATCMLVMGMYGDLLWSSTPHTAPTCTQINNSCSVSSDCCTQQCSGGLCVDAVRTNKTVRTDKTAIQNDTNYSNAGTSTLSATFKNNTVSPSVILHFGDGSTQIIHYGASYIYSTTEYTSISVYATASGYNDSPDTILSTNINGQTYNVMPNTATGCAGASNPACPDASSLDCTSLMIQLSKPSA